MSIDFLKRLGTFLTLCFLQVMLLNHIHLFGFATPLPYIAFVLHFPRSYSKNAILLWSFAMGLVIDIFGNTAGVAATSLTLMGALQPYLQLLFLPHDSEEDQRPSVKALGARSYFFYLFPFTLLYCLLFFSLEMLSFFNWFYWLKCVLGSTVLTMLLIWIFELMRRNSP